MSHLAVFYVCKNSLRYSQYYRKGLAIFVRKTNTNGWVNKPFGDRYIEAGLEVIGSNMYNRVVHCICTVRWSEWRDEAARVCGGAVLCPLAPPPAWTHHGGLEQHRCNVAFVLCTPNWPTSNHHAEMKQRTTYKLINMFPYGSNAL